MKLEKLIEVVELLRKTYESGDYPEPIKEELSMLLPEFIEELFIQGRVSDLEKRVEETRKFDISTVKKGLEIIIKAGPSPIVNKSSGKVIESAPRLEQVKEQVKLIEEKGKEWGPLEIGLRFELVLDSNFDYLLMACEGKEDVFRQLEGLVLEKLKPLKEHEILLLWARIKGLFEGAAWTSPLKQYPDITPPPFWQNASLEKTRKKCAEFIVRLKPKIIRRMMDEGADGYRTGVAGVARILSFNRSLAPVSNLDFLVVRNAAELVAATERLTSLSPDNLARGIGKNPDNLVFRGDLYEDAKRVFSFGPRGPKHLDILLASMKKAIRYVGISSGTPSNIEEQLWRYKLGQEVVSPKYTTEIVKGRINEIDLQKGLCKFLLERGIRAFGKTFGRSQVDIYTKDSVGEDFVIETKVYKNAPSDGTIRKNFSQLLSYMNQELQQQPRGILVIFNCSDSLIMTPREWLHGRVFVLAINIGQSPPSGRKKWIEIKEGDGPGQLIIIKDGKK